MGVNSGALYRVLVSCYGEPIYGYGVDVLNWVRISTTVAVVFRWAVYKHRQVTELHKRQKGV